MGTRRHASASVRTAKAREAPLLPSLPAAGSTQIWLKAGAPAGGLMSNDGSRLSAANASLDSKVSGDTNLRASDASFQPGNVRLMGGPPWAGTPRLRAQARSLEILPHRPSCP